MTCNNCARHATDAIQRVAGVRSALVSLEQGRASIRWNPGATVSVDAVLAAIKQAGYDAKPLDAAEASASGGQRQSHWQANLWIGALGTLPLMTGEWILRLGAAPWFQWLSFALAAAVQVLAGARFYRGAWNQLKVGGANMDTLVALGSTTAFAYSAWALLSGAGGHVYFMEAAAIITLISVGHWLEARASARASSAFQALLHLAPPLARRRNADGTDTEVPVAAIRVNDLVVLKPGDRVPTDGAVVEGDSAVDESMLTGESLPVDKSTGKELYAGTVNQNGRLLMRVTATGEATALANIIAAVQRAQASRANIQRLGDRVSSVFVPVVVLIAVATALGWGLAPQSARAAHDWLAQFLWAAHPPETALAAAFIGAAAVLIVACPCAMGLATPAAIMAGSNAAARRGILIRDGVALEKAGQVTAVLLDKTGTLTAGRPTVVANWEGRAGVPPAPVGDSEVRSPKSEVLAGGTAALLSTGGATRLAAALARHSTHPFSQAVAKLATEDVALADWRELRGSGVQATLRVPKPTAEDDDEHEHADEVRARLGSLTWLGQMGVDVSPARAFVEESSARGATVLGLAIDKKLAGAFAIEDSLKPGAGEMVRRLQRNALKVYLVTGDNAATAARIAQQVGIAAENVFATVRPEQKAELVKQLQARGERVAFVGDGINDAPALEQADLGIAVGRASDVAREAADILLLKSELDAVPEALGLAQATLRTIRQNLFWAFFYNALSVPLAALGFMSPVLCAAAMGLSDLLVIGNALRLRGWRLRN
jgi:Cu+-exporting ATPase